MKGIAIFAFVVCAFFAACFSLIFLALSAECSAKGSKMGFEASWGIQQDCMILVDGRWLPLDAYKVVKVAP